MGFYELLPQVIALLEREGRVSYRALQLEFGFGEVFLDGLREELIYAKRVAAEDGRVLVYTGDTRRQGVVDSPSASRLEEPPPRVEEEAESTPVPVAADAERRQLTVVFCDLVGSTELSGRLAPEDLREVVRAYQKAAAEVIEGFEGHIAQYLGDGLLVYFGYPRAHEDDALRAVAAALGLIKALRALNHRLESEYGVRLAARIGIHTGPVVVGGMGGGDRHAHLALGDTPSIAAALEGLAAPGTIAISASTARLVKAAFVLEDLGVQDLEGVGEPIRVARVVARAERVEARAAARGFAELLGRDEEIGLLLRRWKQCQDGLGQVVLISGEAGIGKSALIDGLRDHVRNAGFNAITYRCSPYAQSSALQPVIRFTRRLLGWQRDDEPEAKLDKLERALAPYALPSDEIVPLLAALFSLSLPEGRYPPLEMTPQQQRRKTLEALAAWLFAEADRKPYVMVWEDLHWADPSTLELLDLVVDQIPAVSALSVLTYRPELAHVWPTASHMTPLVLNRLERPHVETVVDRLAGGKNLPAEIVEHVVTKTDGVPLYVEELTKMLLESGLLAMDEDGDAYVLTGPLSEVTIPSTLQDSLMARLDRQPALREVAQIGAVLGREFAYDVLRALAVLEEATLDERLARLVATELLYQRGWPPRAKYFFRHALIRDAAYGSLLRRTRARYHRKVAELLVARFPEIVEAEPELVAHHYTEAGLGDQAIKYWQLAGRRAAERQALLEAISHFASALKLLEALPETPERHQLELELRLPLGTALMMTRGQGAAEVETTFQRARDLSRQLGDTSELFPALFGLWRFYIMRPDLSTARDLAEQLLRLAEAGAEPSLQVLARYALGITGVVSGTLAEAREHLEDGAARYHPDQRSSPMVRTGQDPGVACLILLAWALWLLGRPEQALARGRQALELARKVADPFTLGYVLNALAVLLQLCREGERVEEHAREGIDLSAERGFGLWLVMATLMHGWALSAQGQKEEGLDRLRKGLAGYRASGAGLMVPFFLVLSAEALADLGLTDDGLDALTEARSLIDETGERWFEAEVYRLRGELLLATSGGRYAEAERCFHQALEVSRRQHAKSLELRAATSLARLWQKGGKPAEARDLLAGVYSSFSEGFDTADLRNAGALLAELTEPAPAADAARGDAQPRREGA